MVNVKQIATEFLGTMFFLGAIYQVAIGSGPGGKSWSSDDVNTVPILIGLALTAAITFGGQISGGRAPWAAASVRPQS